ncbi:RNA exonuclease [Anaeramoeba flamelloides]|uniref:RNA exonuclease n=1 Tax=Anaeramoeba flamelloides TaxID=1746091 RepID=A0AAV8A6L9_9EUKA|nr:RNA exonuclease [Anaeramoeba flamelloides]
MSQFSSNWLKLKQNKTLLQPTPQVQKKKDPETKNNEEEKEIKNNGEGKEKGKEIEKGMENKNKKEKEKEKEKENDTEGENQEEDKKPIKIGKYLSFACDTCISKAQKEEEIIARVSIINYEGKVVYDTYVKPAEYITNYRTAITGITKKLLKHAPSLTEVQEKVSTLINDRTLVGHILKPKLKLLYLNHPHKFTRDISRYQLFLSSRNKKKPLKILAREFLNQEIQQKHHSSVEDARTSMKLYRLIKEDWEKEIKEKHLQKIRKFKKKQQQQQNKTSNKKKRHVSEFIDQSNKKVANESEMTEKERVKHEKMKKYYVNKYNQRKRKKKEKKKRSKQNKKFRKNSFQSKQSADMREFK